MNYAKIDFGSVKYHGHWYFLIGSHITSCNSGEVADPWTKFQVLTRMVIQTRKYMTHI
jgi:hypothetical protein